jgi:hypothetical protein
VFVYFGALGLAYMLLEIAFIQRFMLFLAYPIYSVTVVLTAFLAFSGLGSLFAHHHQHRAHLLLTLTVAAIGVFAVLYLLVLGPLFSAGAGWPDVAKIAASLIMLAPVAFAMGIPFPTGLQLVSMRFDPLLPWAWGINGCASVVGALSASLCAVHMGFRAVVLVAVVAYVGAVLAYLRMASVRTGS